MHALQRILFQGEKAKTVTVYETYIVIFFVKTVRLYSCLVKMFVLAVWVRNLSLNNNSFFFLNVWLFLNAVKDGTMLIVMC